MAIRCKHVALVAGLALALSVSAATDWPTATFTEAAVTTTASKNTMTQQADEASPVPAPVLFLAGGILALVAYLRWRQRSRG